MCAKPVTRASLKAETPLARQSSQAAVLLTLDSLGMIAVHADEAFALQVEDDFLGRFLRTELGGVDV